MEILRVCSQARQLQQSLHQMPSLLTAATTTAKVSFFTCETKSSLVLSCGTCSIGWASLDRLVYYPSLYHSINSCVHVALSWAVRHALAIQ